MSRNMEDLIESTMRLAPFMIMGLLAGAFKDGGSILLIVSYVCSGFAATTAMVLVAVLISNGIRKLRS